MTSINFQQLIDMAIGSPEPGHVNFFALHCVLISFAEKLNIISETVDCSKFGSFSTLINYSKRKSSVVSKQGSKRRIPGGADDPEGDNENEAAGATEVSEPNPDATASPDDVEPAAETAEAAPNTSDMQVAPPAEETGEPIEDASGAAADATEVPDGGELEEATDAVSQMETQPSVISSQKERAGSGEVLRSSIENLEKRLSQIESATELAPVFSIEYARGISVMKDQLELAMDQLLKLTSLTIEKKASPKTYEQLRFLSEKLRTVQKHNVFIEGTSIFRMQKDRSSSREDIGEEEEYIEDGMELNSQLSVKEIEGGEGAASGQPEDQYQLDLHLCYTPEKMLDQLLQMKTEFCLLTNKVNEISATILEQDCQRTTLILQELQDAMRDVKYTTANLKEAHERIDGRLTRNIENIDEMTKGLVDIARDKIDRSEIDVLLADKVDYNQLQRKVSHEQMQELRCQLEKEFCELDRIIKHNERNLLQAMANLQSTIGLDTFNELLNKYKEESVGEVRKVDDKLQKYINATNDDCAAAGARVKVLQDLACLSCDTTCVMRTVEKSPIAKFPNAHATNLLGPLITYELGNIRKSGIMGYHRKDEFPHAPHAWMNRQTVNIKACVPRHAGGPHTVSTAKERVQKVHHSKK